MMFVVTQMGDTDINATSTVATATSTITTSVKADYAAEAEVREYFKDIPLMVDIARCESHFTQFNTDGSVHRGVVNNLDVGVLQINEYYHLETSKKKGMNIHTLEGNMRYARDLYEREGAQPWSSSKPCWGSSEHLAAK